MNDASSSHNLAAALAHAARRWPHLGAIAHGDQLLFGYAALASRAARIAGALSSSGLRPGDRIAIVSRNAPAYIEMLFACWWAGLVAVPVNAKLHPKELAFILSDSGARWAFMDDAWMSQLPAESAASLERVVEFDRDDYARLLDPSNEAAIAPVARNFPAWLFYTSGTTGRPKGVVISHANLWAMTHCFMTDVETIAPGDAILHPAPLSHGSGLYVVPHVVRGAVHVVPGSGGFDAAEVLALLDTWDRALLFAAPTMVKRLIASPAVARANLDRLKCIVYGGGPMYVEDCRAASAALGPRLAQIYGQGESPMTITAMDRTTLADAIARGDDARIGSVGVSQSGIEVRIGGVADEPLGPGEIGEVLVRGPTVMSGYWRNPEATASALAGGWLHTGDLGTLDQHGYLTLKDRSKDLIISGGANIYPREVEEALLAHPAVAEVAVVGRPHPEWGEEVVAFVVARTGENAEDRSAALHRDLDAHCCAHIARFKRPHRYAFVESLPKNNTGKVLKTDLRRLARDLG